MLSRPVSLINALRALLTGLPSYKYDSKERHPELAGQELCLILILEPRTSEKLNQEKIDSGGIRTRDGAFVLV